MRQQHALYITFSNKKCYNMLLATLFCVLYWLGCNIAQNQESIEYFVFNVQWILGKYNIASQPYSWRPVGEIFASPFSKNQTDFILESQHNNTLPMFIHKAICVLMQC